ncbi:MAG: hypothetical protein AB1938_08985 [Myxococcota bacterium]
MAFGVVCVGVAGGLMWLQLSRGVLHNYLLGTAVLAAVVGTVLLGGAVVQRLRLLGAPPSEPGLDRLTPSRTSKYPALTSVELHAHRAQGRPFSVCVGCRVIFPNMVVARCLQCNSAADCVQVVNEDDARTVLATLP